MGETNVPSNERYEALIKEIGEFGRYQKWMCLLLTLSAVPNGYFALSMVYVGHTPEFLCNGSTVFESMYNSVGMANASGVSDHHNETNDIYAVQLPSQSRKNSSKCSTYGLANSSGCPNGYVYLYEVGRTSIVTEWNLVCHRDWMKPLITALYMGGVLVGSLVSGIFADKFGRYPTFMIGTAFMFVFLGLCGISSSPIMFTILLFFAGLFGFMNYVAAFIMASEITNAKYRALTGSLAVGGFAVGYMLLPLFAYFIADWRTLCFVLASTGILYIPYFWLLPESPRWLYSKNKREKFSYLFRKIAVANNVKPEYAEQLLNEFYHDKNGTLGSKLLNDKVHPRNEAEMTVKITNTKAYSYMDLLCIRKVLPRTLCMWLVWFSCSVIYYGVAFNTSNMGGNQYINCFIAAAVEIPAYASVIVLLKWRGRKSILISTLLLSGLTCAATPYLGAVSTELSIASAMIGKLSVSAAFDVGFIVCSELFPTRMRSMAVGSSSMAARVGGMAAPYMLYLGNSNRYVPNLLMGLLGVCAAVSYIFMPETKSSAMPETVQDLQSVKRFQCDILLKKKTTTTS